MTDWHSQDGLRWRALSPFGAELDTNLAAPLSPAAEQRFVSLFRKHSLLIAHKQTLSMERQRELCGLLGPILLREGESGYLSSEGEHKVIRSGLAFHADAAYTNAPFDAIALHAIDVVDRASSTRFVSAQNGYDNLPKELREEFDDREAEMITPGFDILAARVCDIRDPEFMLKSLRPTVVKNPNSGRRYLNMSEMHTARLPDLEWAQSRDLINRVFDYLYTPENRFEHVWRQGDLVIWDNQALQHGRGSLEDAGKRILQRVIVGTEGVAPHAIKKSA